jgi:hypothetical protein
MVARLAGLQPVLDGPGEFGLPGVVGDMAADPGGQTGRARQLPATTANATPSSMASMAAPVASRAWSIFATGSPIDPEQSMMMISAAPAVTSAGPSAMEPADVTVTMALTSRTRSGRYSFWKTSPVNPGALIAARSCGLRGRYLGRA